MERQHRTIVLPTRPQIDTVIAVFLLRAFGEERFPGIREAELSFVPTLAPGETEASLGAKGIVLLDLGGGRFDHHAAQEKTTASDLVAAELGVQDDPAIQKLLEFARRDDFFGKGIISTDALDRAFGLPGLLVNLNKQWPDDPAKVLALTLPLIEAHYTEEVRRTKEMPKEFEDKLARGEAEAFTVKQRDKNLKVVVLASDNPSLPGFLRSQLGGRFDVVAQQLSSGHMNILTRPTKHVDLRGLAAAVRREEATRAGIALRTPDVDLMRTGRIDAVPQWYFDPATNSLQNGGLNPKDIPATRIGRKEFKAILIEGLSL